MSGPSRDAGLTLVEMLVVLAIVGVMASVVTIGIGSATRKVGAEAEAHHLADDLQRAADEALVGGPSLALVLERDGYGVVQRSGGEGWKPFEPHRPLASGLTLASATLGAPQPLLADGMTTPIEATITDGRRGWRVAFDGLKATVVAGAAS